MIAGRPVVSNLDSHSCPDRCNGPGSHARRAAGAV